jgi:D-alanine-D-alanine ligase
MRSARMKVGLLFGGRSAEHEVSKMSAANILRALDPDLYEVIPIGIRRDGRWVLAEAGNGAGTGAKALQIPDDAPQVALVPGGQGEMIVMDGREQLRLDLVFPALHGPNGEDGTIQGLMALVDLPFVGSGVMGSSAGMDKDVAKRLLRDGGVPVVPFLTLTQAADATYGEASAALGTGDLFVKPANMGSSVGVSPARSQAEYDKAVALAFRYDRKVLVEQGIMGAREVECSVLEDASGALRASPLGEIVPAGGHGFYSYEAKYIDENGAAFRVPADMSADETRRAQEIAVKAFRMLCCEGLARVDFLLDRRDGSLYLNEVNTLPGFTSISMYPKLWEAGGLSQPDLMNVLIDHALARHERRRALHQPPT